jgi:predicted transposase/invertase (TIGR01784 family)
MAIIPPDADILPPSDDHIFKTLLTHPGATPIVVDVVAAVTSHNIVSAQVLNNELPVTDANEKNERLDVNCTVIDENTQKRQINVEMQGSRMEELAGSNLNFRSKYAYYGMDLFTSQESKGVDYADLMQTYQITFCNYTVFPERPDFVHRVALRFQDGELFSDQLCIVIVEMSKLGYALNKRVEELTPIEIWGLFFGHAQDTNYREIINRIIETKEEVGMASELLMEISKNEAERARIRSRKKFEMDQTSNLITAEKRGRIEERQDNIRLMHHQLGLSVEVIAKAFGLSEQEVKNILGI